jgi:MFS family permease
VHALYKWFPDAKRNLPVAVLHQGSAFGLLVAGLTIPAITAHWGWRANFLVLSVLGSLWCVAWLVFGAEGKMSSPVRSDHTARVPYALLLTDRTVLGVFAGHFAANWILAMTLTWTPTWLQLGMGYAPQTAGRMFALFVAITAPLSLGMAWLSQRLLTRGVPSRVGRGGFLTVTLVVAGALLASTAWPGLPPMLRFVLLTLGSGMTLVTYSIGPAMLGEVTPDSQRGGVLALSNGFSSLAGLAAPIVTGLLIEGAGRSTAVGFEQAWCCWDAACCALSASTRSARYAVSPSARHVRRGNSTWSSGADGTAKTVYCRVPRSTRQFHTLLVIQMNEHRIIKETYEEGFVCDADERAFRRSLCAIECHAVR